MDQEHQGGLSAPATEPAPPAPEGAPPWFSTTASTAVPSVPNPALAPQPGESSLPGESSPASPAPPAVRRFSWRLVVLVLVVALVGGGVGAAIALAVNPQSTSTIKEVAPGPALAGGASIPAIVQKILPEVVTIDATGPSSGSFLGGSSTQEDQGTGMIISTGGDIVTNNHVIDGATSIKVTLYHQTTALAAKLIGADPGSDLALLKITSPPAGLKAVSFGDSTELQVGDAVIAIGNALGLSSGTPTVTSGIVSATGRAVAAGDQTDGNTENLTNMIQTDAAINSGNSGGPLVDSAGQVIAMNTAVASSSDGNAPAQNIGFAIPSSTIEGLLPTLRSGGTTSAAGGYLGVEVVDMTDQIQQQYGLTPATGALVVSTVPGAPADAAGIQVSDVIVSFNGHDVSSAQDLLTDVQRSTPGTKATMSVWRGNQKLTVSVTLGQAPAS